MSPRTLVKLSAVALVLFEATLLLAKLGLPGYSHLLHPVALRGGSGLPGAMLFNAGAFLLPGIALLLVAHGLRAALQGMGWTVRIGLTLAQLSILAFAMQGLLPLDLRDLDATASRLHALAWMLWWIAFVPGMLLLALGMRQRRRFALLCVVCGLSIPMLALLAPVDGWVGLAQRLAFGLWFGWWLLAAYCAGREPQIR